MPFCSSTRLFASSLKSRSAIVFHRTILLISSGLLAAAFFAVPDLSAQGHNRITQPVDTSSAQALPNHHPFWASPANNIGSVPPDLPLDQLTLVLSRSPQQEAAFQQFLADQQNPASPNYHHWLTPAEVGQRFGLSDQDIAAITGWLQSQGLHVNWVSPSRIFVGFGGSAEVVGRAFQTEMQYYSIRGAQRLSVNSDPMIPAAIAPAIKAIRGLYTIDEQPLYQARGMQSVSPLETANSGNHYLAPADFATIYDLPASLTGAGMTIGIVDRSRTNFADFSNLRALTGSTFPNPTEIVPTAFGGVDPGPAYTAPPGGTTSTSEQGEATLDVVRAGTVAPGASLLLVVATAASGGIEVDAQFLVQTTPVPAQVMTISFGACESSAGTAGVTFWDTLFQQAAAEGISSFVSSGDAGASGCDTHGSAPPANPLPNSPNYICSSSYVTCVGGTEFNEGSNPSQYWTSGNGAGLLSVLSYIPEGAWNESTASKVSASGGGVSSVIPTPSWQIGNGVPAARAGRYTPDISFSSSGHDAYFTCLAANGYSCVVSGGGYTFGAFYGTSAAAPDMAGITALLDQKLGAPQGNLNPEIYSLAAAVPAAFHDVTVATSGVATCDINTASMCNNSIALLSGSGAQPGFLVGTGYDEATGLGSLDVNAFLNNYTPPKTTPTVTVNLSSSSITTAQPLTVTITVSNGNSIFIPMGTVTLTSGAYASMTLTLVSGSASISIPAGSLAVGTDTLTANYTPQPSGSNFYTPASGSATVTVTAVTKITPVVAVTLSAPNITTAQQLTVTVAVNGGTGNQVPTGTVTLAGTGYSSGPTTLANGSATINVSAGSLPAGADTLSASYSPDTTSSSIYNAASGSNSVTVTTVSKITPTVTVTPYPLSVTTGQNVSLYVVVNGGTGNQLPTGNIKLTAGTFNTGAFLSNGSALLNLGPGSLPPGSDTLTATYTPDSASSSIYNTASGSNTITVTMLTPAVTVTPSPAAVTVAQGSTVTVDVFSTGNQTATGSVTLTSGSYSSGAINLIVGTASIAVPAGALAPGADMLTAHYTPDSSSSTIYSAATGSSTITVTKATPIITWNTPPAVTVGTALSATQLNATSNVPGTFVYAPALGTVMSTIGSTPLSTTFTPTDTTNYTTATASVALTVSAITPVFTVVGTAVTVTAGATTGNNSTITVTPSNSFTGSAAVTLTAVITTSPSGSVNTPTLSLGTTSSVSITSTSPSTATLIISTTASQTTSCVASNQIPRGIPWYAKGGAVLACTLLLGIAPQRRKWRSMLGMVMLLVALGGGALACGGGSSTSCTSTTTPGTTVGSYTITITGTSSATTATNTIALTVK
jgi:subtilase family serine protease